MIGDGVDCALTGVVSVGMTARVVDVGVGDDMGCGVTELRLTLPSLEFEYLGQGWLNLPPYRGTRRSLGCYHGGIAVVSTTRVRVPWGRTMRRHSGSVKACKHRNYNPDALRGWHRSQELRSVETP